MRSLVVSGMYRASGALFRTMETVAEENPLRSATSRMVTAAGAARLREDSEIDARRDFPAETLRVGFESAGSMDSLKCHLKFSPLRGGHYRTMHRVSSFRRLLVVLSYARSCESNQFRTLVSNSGP